MFITLFEKYILRRDPKREFTEALIIDISAIFLWRGVWGIIDLYFFPTHPEYSFWLSIVVGFLLIILAKRLYK